MKYAALLALAALAALAVASIARASAPSPRPSERPYWTVGPWREDPFDSEFWAHSFDVPTPPVTEAG